ncbi:Fasciclin-like arabinogalactan protein 3 [Linum perenne]
MSSSSTNIQRLFSTILVIFISFTSSSSAFNVTSLLGPLPQFSTFSNYLTQVGLVQMISDLKNVTILAVPNSKMASISGKSRDEIKRIMSMHVIPEYYDLDSLKMKTLPHGSASLRTVYVLTGLAKGKQGLLLVTQRERSNSHLFFTFSSAVPPNLRPNNVNLVQSVVVPSHNISVFHVSDLISSPPPPPLVATELAGSRISISSKVLMKLDQEAADSDELSILPKTSMDFVLVPPPAKAPAKAPTKSAAAASPMKSSTKAPSPSSSSKFGDQKGKSPSSGAPSLGTAPPPAPAIKKPDVPASAPKKPVVPSNPPTEPKAKASGPPTSESSPPPPPPSGSTSTPPPSGTTSAPPPSGTTSAPPPFGTTSTPPPSSTTSAPPPTESPAEIVTPPPPSVEAPAKSSPPTPSAEAPTMASPSGDATPSVEAPKGGATLMTVNKLGVMVTTVMALWALAA